jgi:hypothetical protein
MSSPKTRVGDKVEVRVNPRQAPVRGIVSSSQNDLVSVLLDDGRTVTVETDTLRNYSLAARKAWVKMPNRHVGRPKGTSQSDRVSVTLRFDRPLWQRFLMLEQEGLTGDRVQLFNRILNEIVTKKGKHQMLALNRSPKGSTS